jgi:hypothetical protein
MFIKQEAIRLRPGASEAHLLAAGVAFLAICASPIPNIYQIAQGAQLQRHNPVGESSPAQSADPGQHPSPEHFAADVQGNSPIAPDACPCGQQSFARDLVTFVAKSVCDLLDQFAADYDQNRLWPQPFSQADRAAIRPAFQQMIANGWKQQNLLSTPHFSPNQEQLTEAGKAKVRWVATQVPQPRRVLFVESPTPAIGQRRIAAVQHYLESLQLEGSPPLVVPTTTAARFASGSELGAIHQKFHQSAPTPRLPAYEPMQVKSP